MNILEDLMLEEVSLVDRPANAQSEVALFKRDNQQEDISKMTDREKKVKMYMEKGYSKEEAEKMCDRDMKAKKADDLEEQMKSLKANNEMLTKALISEGFVISSEGVSKKAPEEQIEIEGEMVNKSDIPAPVLKALEAAEMEKADVALTKRAEEELGNMPVEKAKELLKSFEEDKEMMEFLAALDAALGGHFEEVGKTDKEGDLSDPTEKLNALAKAYAAENKVSKEKGYAAVLKTDEGKALYKASLNKEDE